MKYKIWNNKEKKYESDKEYLVYGDGKTIARVHPMDGELESVDSKDYTIYWEADKAVTIDFYGFDTTSEIDLGRP